MEFTGSPVVGFATFTTGAWVQSLVEELRSHKLHSMTKTNNPSLKKKKKENMRPD